MGRCVIWGSVEITKLTYNKAGLLKLPIQIDRNIDYEALKLKYSLKSHSRQLRSLNFSAWCQGKLARSASLLFSRSLQLAAAVGLCLVGSQSTPTALNPPKFATTPVGML